MPYYEDWEKESPLHKHAYNGHQYRVSGVSGKIMIDSDRQEVLDDFMKTKLGKEGRNNEWGEPNTEERLRETIKHIMFLVDKPRNEECRKQWWRDVKYLVREHLFKLDNLDEDKVIRFLVEGYIR